jgi:hypothetical protein
MFNDDTEEEVIEEDYTEVEEVQEETEEEEDTTDWKAVAAEEKAKREKAEQTIIKAKQKPKVESVTTNGLSTSDIIALTRANIADEDIEEVLDYAKYRKISVAEALKSSVVKATLSEKSEERKSAQAVHTGGGTRRAGGTISDERLLADASKGIMPDSEEDIARIARLKFLKK